MGCHRLIVQGLYKIYGSKSIWLHGMISEGKTTEKRVMDYSKNVGHDLSSDMEKFDLDL